MRQKGLAVPATAELTVHPATPDQAVRGLAAEVAWQPHAALLSLLYRLDAQTAALCLPAPRPARRADGLWQHTCFEAFVRAGGAQAYYEFNCSTSGEWAAYRFESRRDGMQQAQRLAAPRIGVLRGSGMLDVSIDLDLTQLEDLASATRLDIGLAAVIEHTDGQRSYWALRHGSAQPDFHDPDTFILHFEGRTTA